MRWLIAGLLSVTGCNVVPPLDCLAGANRPGCQRDADGQYQYLYRSALTPNGIYEAPAYAPAAPLPGSPFVYQPLPVAPFVYQPPVRTTCTRSFDTVNCTTQ